MINRYKLNEDNLPEKLPVRFSFRVSQTIDNIIRKNRNNTEAISQWLNYLDNIKNYISNPVIAFDYTNRYRQLSDRRRFISDFDFNVGYTILNDYTTEQPFVYVFMINLKSDEYGLKENIQHKKQVQLSEYQLRKIIRESIRRMLYDTNKP